MRKKDNFDLGNRNNQINTSISKNNFGLERVQHWIFVRYCLCDGVVRQGTVIDLNKVTLNR